MVQQWWSDEYNRGVVVCSCACHDVLALIPDSPDESLRIHRIVEACLPEEAVIACRLCVADHTGDRNHT